MIVSFSLMFWAFTYFKKRFHKYVRTREPASWVFLAPPEGLMTLLSSLYYAWQLLLAKFFDLVKLEFWPPGPPEPYQFGFREHSNITRWRTNRNQLVNIYLMVFLSGSLCPQICYFSINKFDTWNVNFPPIGCSKGSATDTLVHWTVRILSKGPCSL